MPSLNPFYNSAIFFKFNDRYINFGVMYDYSKFLTLTHIKFTDFFYSVEAPWEGKLGLN